nr:hypothetical protein CFP56_65169 [Quercus suber]
MELRPRRQRPRARAAERGSRFPHRFRGTTRCHGRRRRRRGWRARACRLRPSCVAFSSVLGKIAEQKGVNGPYYSFVPSSLGSRSLRGAGSWDMFLNYTFFSLHGGRSAGLMV